MAITKDKVRMGLPVTFKRQGKLRKGIIQFDNQHTLNDDVVVQCEDGEQVSVSPEKLTTFRGARCGKA